MRVMFLMALMGCGQKASDDGDASDCGQDCDTGTTGSDCDPEADPDEDGLSDCDEGELGTDPDDDDSDGDGYTDASEVDCGSDPVDADDVCYACGWTQTDPGDLQSTGNENGDVVDNVRGVDQCGDEVALWGHAGQYHVLFLTAAW